jgi:thymidylate synthase (FAD)
MKIHLIGRPQFDLDAFINFLDSQGLTWERTKEAKQPEEIVEVSGRVCYMSFGPKQSPRSNTEYIRNLVNNEHESVLEHVSWTFLITGISRALTHQLVRHRIGFSYSQLSQQYHDETDAEFIEPNQLNDFPEALALWQDAVQSAKEAYKRILESLDTASAVAGEPTSKKEDKRAVRSAARSVLPNATETKIVVTANARALRHFLKLRGAILGDEEMRRLSANLLHHLKAEAPVLFFDFYTESLLDGSPIVRYDNEA